uniref:Uncharacterized protein n=1 Tax=Gasterosteus aculeatus aculeatus TaxID=481459 RepID=A0AAQ4PB37_GASAC
MEDRNDSPAAVRVEEHSRGVVLTYFQGDINTMVDAHFTRALGNVSRSKAPAARTKKTRKIIKLVPRLPPVPRWIESHRATIRHISAQPAA